MKNKIRVYNTFCTVKNINDIITITNINSIPKQYNLYYSNQLISQNMNLLW